MVVLAILSVLPLSHSMVVLNKAVLPPASSEAHVASSVEPGLAGSVVTVSFLMPTMGAELVPSAAVPVQVAVPLAEVTTGPAEANWVLGSAATAGDGNLGGRGPNHWGMRPSRFSTPVSVWPWHWWCKRRCSLHRR